MSVVFASFMLTGCLYSKQPLLPGGDIVPGIAGTYVSYQEGEAVRHVITQDGSKYRVERRGDELEVTLHKMRGTPFYIMQTRSISSLVRGNVWAYSMVYFGESATSPSIGHAPDRYALIRFNAPDDKPLAEVEAKTAADVMKRFEAAVPNFLSPDGITPFLKIKD